MFWSLYLFKPSSAGIQKKHWGRFIVCAATGVALNQILFIQGITLTTSIHGALLMLASPIFLTFIAAWLLKENLGAKKIIGLVVGVSGATFLVLMKENSVHGSNVILGDMLVLMNAICYAFYLVLVRPLMKEYSPVHVIRWVFTIGTFMILPFGWNQFIHINWPALPSNAWLSLSFVVLGATFFAYLFNIYGIQHIGPSATGSYIYTQPVFASVIANFFFSEQFTIEKGIAAVLIFSGVYLVNSKGGQLEE
jgi:drug/metabolite transporter (DMT)-like permease